MLLSLKVELQAPAECKSLKLNAATPAQDQEGKLPSCCCCCTALAEATLSLSCKQHCQHKPRVSAVLLLELTLLRRHEHMSLKMKAPQGTVCMSLMLVADVAVVKLR